MKSITVIIGAIVFALALTENSTRKKLTLTSLASGEVHVNKVKQKQHDIINMVLKRVHPRSNASLVNNLKPTNEFLYQTSQPQHVTMVQSSDSIQLARFRPNPQPSTASYMEFYYLDNSDDTDRNEKKSMFPYVKTGHIANKDSIMYKIAFLHTPFTLLLLKTTNRYTLNFGKDKQVKTNSIKKLPSRSLEHEACTPLPVLKINNNTFDSKTLSNITEKGSTNIKSIKSRGNIKSISTISSKKYSQKYGYTTVYDRIKFFDIYDSDTYPPISMPFKYKINKIENIYDHNQNQNIHEIDTDDVISEGDLSRYAKKSVISIETNVNMVKEDNSFTYTTPQIISSTTSKRFSYLSQSASWSDYPFVAVYTYEPAQVHCDCASINPYWLVSSAMCLFHQRDLRMEERSAFVSYCSNNWRRPERIAYVRRRLIHPSFKPLDKTRRHLYNMGIIQVTNSMANTCNGWQPIPLMSHQFVADPEGTLATAVGWGLDRYDTTYTTSELPSHRLMLYEGRVYSDSCPGNSDYSAAKRLNEENVKNVFCLSLPAYVNEENDPVHGSILLVEGKLIALYLQEERRPRGDQSAQYTGIWRLIPWLLDVTQEIDEQDPFGAEI